MIRWTWPNWITVSLMGLTAYVAVIAIMAVVGGGGSDGVEASAEIGGAGADAEVYS